MVPGLTPGPVPGLVLGPARNEDGVASNWVVENGLFFPAGTVLAHRPSYKLYGLELEGFPPRTVEKALDFFY